MCRFIMVTGVSLRLTYDSATAAYGHLLPYLIQNIGIFLIAYPPSLYTHTRCSQYIPSSRFFSSLILKTFRP
jgi:hypothetical protein